VILSKLQRFISCHVVVALRICNNNRRCSALELAEFSYFMNNRFDPSSAAPIRGSHQMVSLVLHWYSGMCAPSSPPPSCAPMLLMYAEIMELSVSCAWVAWIVWLELDTNCRRISLIVPSCIEASYVANSVLSEISFLQSIVLQLRMCGRSSVFVYFSKIAKCTTIIRKCAWGWLYNNKISCFGA
jgi:hypothetical protein